MRTVRKFNGETGSYTGDDPIVKYRMGITDEYKNNAPYKSDDQGLTPAIKEKPTFETAMGNSPKIDAATREQALYENAPRFIKKGFNKKSINSDRMVRKDILNEFPKSKAGVVAYDENPEYLHAGYKSGGKVKSASARADGCAIRGKTRA